eukprot:2734799-Amphidinium_carterae.3
MLSPCCWALNFRVSWGHKTCPRSHSKLTNLCSCDMRSLTVTCVRVTCEGMSMVLASLGVDDDLDREARLVSAT